MKQENKFLSRLLPLEELFELYSKVGDSINTDIDLSNANYDYLAKNNSIQLLLTLGFIKEESDFFYKCTNNTTIELFAEELLKQIKIFYRGSIDTIHESILHYDEATGLFYGYRNDLSLDEAGLTMLLGDLGYIKLTETRFYCTDTDISEKHYKNKRGPQPITLVELENCLAFKKQLGEEAEQKALQFEKNILQQKGIDKQPIQISHQDSSAGYDIASYNEPSSEIPDKFIEVKNCKDDYSFYLSKNEIETALKKGKDYFLYLYNRTNGEIIVVENPYESVFENPKWIKDPQIFRVKKI